MAAHKPSERLKKYKEKYREQRSRFWDGVNEQLDHLQHTYGVAVTELAEGLGISRQKIYDFRAAPEKGLPIDRTDLLILWEWLTDPDALNSKRLSPENRQKRETLRQAGPDPLLKAVGYLPSSKDVASEDGQTIEPKIDSSLKRVEARLSSPWIEDGIRRAQIIDSILDEVKAQGRLDKAFHSQPISAAEALDWLSGAPMYITDTTIIREYQKKIRKLAQSGKNQFVGVELFELYQNLLEYESIDNYSGAKVNIIDCQFYLLSAPLPTSVHREFEVFSQHNQQAEKVLLQQLCDLEDFSLKASDTTLFPTTFTPVVRAVITSQFEGEEQPIVWRYSSTGTHLENMLAAITCGLGHSLEITGFSIQATGTTSKSLARVSIGLAERDNAGNISRVYQGWWVDSNAITAVLVATLIATKDWLSNYSIDLTRYFSTCHQLGEIDNTLYHIRENVQEYFFRAASGYSQTDESLDDDSIFDDIESRILSLEKSLMQERDLPYYSIRSQALKNKLIKTKLGRMRLALKNSEVGKAGQYMNEAKLFITTYENANFLDTKDESEEDAYRHILFLQASECVMLNNFYAGDGEFLAGKLWRYRSRYRLDEGLKKLGKYLKFIGSLNFELFSCASHIFGVVGLLELYMAEEKDANFLEQAAEHLLWAAHYSKRIGYVRRATFWFTHASRIYCRLGDLEKSERLSRIVQVTAESVHQTYQEESDYDSKFKIFIAAITHLAEGERLLVRDKPEEAIEAFLKALKTFVDIHSANRLTADALYGLYRASYETDGKVGEVFAEFSCNDSHPHLEAGMVVVLQDIIHSLKQIDPQSSWGSVSLSFKDLAKAIWHHWAEVGSEASDNHPIEVAMDRDRFLTPVTPA